MMRDSEGKIIPSHFLLTSFSQFNFFRKKSFPFKKKSFYAIMREYFSNQHFPREAKWQYGVSFEIIIHLPSATTNIREEG